MRNSNKQPFISIIMNCHNSSRYLNESLSSVISQSYIFWELIFWDNKSTDSSADIFKSFDDSRFKYFYSDKFTSLGEARNLAIGKAKGELIAFLDCDDIWLSDKLEKQVPCFLDKEVGIVICNSIYFNYARNIKVLYKKSPPQGYIFRQLLDSYFISLETVIIRNRFLKQLSHYFDERFEVIEEFDMLLRLSRVCKVAYVNKELAKWRVHNASLTWKKKERFPFETRIFLKKMSNLIPNFREKYKVEIKKIMINILFQEFIINWEVGNFGKSRINLIPYIFKSKKIFIVYFWSYILPFYTFNFFYKIKNGLLNI